MKEIFKDIISYFMELNNFSSFDELKQFMGSNSYDFNTQCYKYNYYLSGEKKVLFAAFAFDNHISIIPTLFNGLNSSEKLQLLEFILKYKLNMSETIGYLGLSEEHLKFIADNVYDFAFLGCNIYELKEKLKLYKGVLDKLDQFTLDYPDRYKDIFREKYDSESLNYYWDFIYLVLKEVMDIEKVSFRSLNWIGEGRYCSVLGVGNKVIKIGYNRATEKFPNNPYVNRMLLRKTFNDDGHKLFIEVAETNDFADYSVDEIYGLYKKLRDLGVVWTDIDARNIGVLRKDKDDNATDNLFPTDDSLNLLPYRDDGTHLKKGDLVLSDGDYLFLEDDPNVPFDNPDTLFYEFEQRYQREKSSSMKHG